MRFLANYSRFIKIEPAVKARYRETSPDEKKRKKGGAEEKERFIIYPEVEISRRDKPGECKRDERRDDDSRT